MRGERLDKLLVQRGLVSSREKARALIMAGKVLVDGRVGRKASELIHPEADLRIKEGLPYVSRGGLKLERALDHFGIRVEGKVAMDVGASTGGFTDCLLKRGAKRVYAVDVGYGQLAWELQKDPRVVNLQRRNIRYLSEEEVGEKVDLATIDTSFISLKIVIPATVRFLRPGGEIIALIKPQFEVGRGKVGKGGVVRDPELHREVIEEIWGFCLQRGLSPQGVVESPLPGPKGNREFFIYVLVPQDG